MVGAVDLVDQQHDLVRPPQRCQHRPLDQEIVAVDVERLAVLRLPDGEHLAWIIPFVERGGRIDALEALQADELAPEDAGERLGGLGLADAGRALQQQRLAEREREVAGRRDAVIGEIHRRLEGLGEVLGAGDAGDGCPQRHRVTASSPGRHGGDQAWRRQWP